MTIPGSFQSNIDTLYPLLEYNHPLSTLLVPGWSPNTISSYDTLWSKTTSTPWVSFAIHGKADVSEQLNKTLSTTMVIFFKTIRMMIRCQDNYIRHLTNIINGKLISTTDISNNRFNLKQIYDNVVPFIKKLAKNDTVVTRELFALLAKKQEGILDSTKRFRKDHLKAINKEIAAIIYIECIYGQLLPYRTIIQSVTSDVPSIVTTMRSLTQDLFSKIDFKTTCRALTLFRGLVRPKMPSLTECCDIWYDKNIPLIRYPNYKMDRWRRSLKPGSEVTLRRGTTITLGKRLSPVKDGLDGKIIFKMANDPYVVVFYPNPLYHDFITKRVLNNSCAVRTPPIKDYDRGHRWSTEPYIEQKPLPLEKFLNLVDYFHTKGPLTTIHFSSIAPGPTHTLTLKPIYPGGIDYAAFVESLIAYYESGVYHKEYPTLYKFLDQCLERANVKYQRFFTDIAARAMGIPTTNEQSEIDYVIDTAMMNKSKISVPTEGHENMSNEKFNERCRQMVYNILRRRKNYLKAFKNRQTQGYNSFLENQLIRNKQETFPIRVRAWILPPE